jgi:hypothetical protein
MQWFIDQLIIETLTHWFIHSLIFDALIDWLVDSLVHGFIGGPIHWFVDSQNHWFTDCMHWFVGSLNHCFIDPLGHWFIASLLHCFTDSLNLWLNGSSSSLLIHCFFPSSSHWLIGSLAPWFIDSLVHWFIQPVVHGFFHLLLLASQQPFAHLLVHFTNSALRGFCISKAFLSAIFFLESYMFFEISSPARAGHYWALIIIRYHWDALGVKHILATKRHWRS